MQKLASCGKMCHTQRKANALALASSCYRRAYYCPTCQAWHTTSQLLPGDAPQHYRIATTRFEK